MDLIQQIKLLCIFLLGALFCSPVYASNLDLLLNDASDQLLSFFAQTKGKVIARSESDIYISLGQKDGARQDEGIDIISAGEVITDPDTGEILGEEEGETYRSKITQVYRNYSVCIPYESAANIKIGDIVLRKLDELYFLLLPARVINHKVQSDIERTIVIGLETRLIETTQIKIVERNRIDSAIHELEFQKSSLVRSDGLKNLGKMVNADVVLATKLVVYPYEIELLVNAISVESGMIIGSFTSTVSKDPEIWAGLNENKPQILEYGRFTNYGVKNK